MNDKLWRLLDAAKSVNPSAQFRDRLWTRIEADQQSWIPMPSFATAVLTLFLLWGIGATTGLALYRTQLSSAPTPTEESIHQFTQTTLSQSFEGILKTR